MILIEAGAWTDASFAAKALLARRLARRGHRVMIDDASFPAGFPARQKYELSDLLADPATTTPDRLILPHPRLQDRAFVLVPLADVAPDWVHPRTGLSRGRRRRAGSARRRR